MRKRLKKQKKTDTVAGNPALLRDPAAVVEPGQTPDGGVKSGI